MIQSNYKLLFFFFTVFVLCFFTVKAQTHNDPASIQVVSSENPITIDGQLDEIDWKERRYDYLVFGANALPGDVSYTVTDSVTVKHSYTDSTLTLVKILHYGMDLYISLDSKDQSVGPFGSSWEGDGLFMKIKNASGVPKEYKLFFNAGGSDPDIVFETNAPEGSGSGAAWKHPQTVVNDTTQIDSGYTAELVIHLDQLGYTDPLSEVEVLINIFDPDGYTKDTDPFGEAGAYFKSWWGSEWGDEYRILKLADPPTKNAISTSETIILDGQMTESFWDNAEYIIVGRGSSTSTGGYYAQWTDPNNEYTDQSMATVKFAHNGTDLYIGVESNDKSVCYWAPSWEADGLFLWITNKGENPPPARMEIKNMFFDQTVGAPAEFQLSDNVPTGGAEGASFLPAGTVTQTEVGGEDAGYSLEVVIHTDFFGYSDGDAVNLSVVVWDVDFGDDVSYDENVSDYAPNWWGTQWADPTFERHYMYRQVVLPDLTTDVETTEELPTAYALDQNYPNPFNPSTKISFSLPEQSNVTLKIFDILGNEVATVINEKRSAGSYSVDWNAGNLSSGIYFYSLIADNFVQTKKMILIK